MNGNNFALCTHSNTKNFKIEGNIAFISMFVLIFQFLFTFCHLTHNIQATFLELDEPIFNCVMNSQNTKKIFKYCGRILHMIPTNPQFLKTSQSCIVCLTGRHNIQLCNVQSEC